MIGSFFEISLRYKVEIHIIYLKFIATDIKEIKFLKNTSLRSKSVQVALTSRNLRKPATLCEGNNIENTV